MSVYNRICNGLPAFIVGIIIFYIAIGYTLIRLNDNRGKSYNSPITTLAPFWVLAAFTIYSFLAVQFVDAGRWSNSNKENKVLPYIQRIQRSLTPQLLINPSSNRGLEYIYPCLEVKDNNCRRYCRKCKMYKPDRTHHCYTCCACIVNMDHHCVFVNNCLGYHNYKYFMLFLIYAVLANAYISINLIYNDILTVLMFGSFKYRINLGIIFILSTCFAIVLGIFTLFHINMRSKNFTTIEYMEKQSELKYGVEYHNPYNIGFINNLNTFLGTNKLLWFIPIFDKSIRPVYKQYNSIVNELIHLGVVYPHNLPEHPQSKLFNLTDNVQQPKPDNDNENENEDEDSKENKTYNTVSQRRKKNTK